MAGDRGKLERIPTNICRCNHVSAVQATYNISTDREVSRTFTMVVVPGCRVPFSDARTVRIVEAVFVFRIADRPHRRDEHEDADEDIHRRDFD
jgi:hypothetical protein